MPPRLRIARALAALQLAALGLPTLAHAQKTDVIKLVNGDEITGDIKGVAFGKLDYNTDDAGRLSIKWTKVLRVTSVHYFEVEVSSGLRYFGQLKNAGEDGRVVVELNRTDTLIIGQIVRVVPLNNRFIDRIKAYLDAGFTLAKANKATTLNVNTEFEYRAAVWGLKLTANSYFQKQENTDRSTRNSGTLTAQRYFPRRWQAVALLGAEQNDQLGLLLRGTFGGGAGYVVKQTNNTTLQLGAGAVVTREHFALSDTTPGASPDTLKSNLEALVTATWNAFRLDTPKLDFSTQINAFPSVTTLGRVRGDVTLRIKYEIFKDFYLGANLTDNFDSQPPEASASKNDFVTSITVGWSYRR
jgi:hypothetical protein